MPDTPNDITAAIDEAEKALRDSAYVTVGLAVLAFQRAQVRRRELAKRLSPLAPQWSEPWSGVADQFNDQGGRLSDQLGEVSRSLGTNLDSARAQLRELVRSFDGWAAPARRQIEERLDTVAELLPAGARDVVGAVRSAAAGPEARLRAAAGLD